MKYSDLYIQKHNSNAMYGFGAVHLLPAISLFVDYLQPRTILDYGCGKGGLVRALQEKYPNLKVFGYDPAVEEFAELWISKVDFIICTDVLEHIPEKELYATVERISSLSQKCFFHLHHAKASEILDNGENAHCTIAPPQWYHDLFNSFFDEVHPIFGFSAVNTGCITFSVPEAVVDAYTELASNGEDEHRMQCNVKISQLLSLLKSDFSKILPERTVFYGCGATSKIVLTKVKNAENIICFLDHKASLGETYLDKPVCSIENYKAVGDETIIVFPTYDFEKIVNDIKRVIPNYKMIYRAEDFF